MTYCLVYITASTAEEARRIGAALVEERLAACANVIDGMCAIYRWEGKVENAEEAVLIAKTREDLLDALTERVKALHSYEIPCVVGIPIVGGNADFLDWIGAETT
jgi:periplasmic divalent cation tolerance protein